MQGQLRRMLHRAVDFNSAIPGMPDGKPAGVRCVQLADDNRCRIFNSPERPAFCGGLQASAEMCGPKREQAIGWLDKLERATAPAQCADLWIALL